MKFQLFIFALTLFVLSTISYGQNEVVDSLKRELNKAGDEEKLNLFSALGEELLRTDPPSAIFYANELYQLSAKKEDHQWISTSYHLLGRAYFFSGNVEQSDSIYAVSVEFEQNLDPVDQVRLAWTLVNYGNYYKWKGNYREALNAFKKGLDVSLESGNKPQQTDCLVNIGAMYLYMGINDSAGIYFEPAKQLAYAIKDTSTLQTVSNNMANVYESQGEYEKALDELIIAEKFSQTDIDFAYVYGTRGNIYYYLGQMDSAVHNMNLSVEYFRKDGRQLEEGMVINMLGEFFVDNGDYEAARNEFNKAIAIFTKLRNEDFLSGVYINVADLFFEEGELDSSYHYYQNALELAINVGNDNHIGTAYHSLGTIEKERGNIQGAYYMTSKSVAIFEKIGDQRLIAEGYESMAGLNIEMGQYAQAKTNALKALEISELTGNIRLQIKSYDRFIQAFAFASGNKNLYEYHNLQILLQDSLRSIDNFNAVEELSVQYDLKEKEDSIRLQNIEIENQQAINDKISIINQQRGTLLWVSALGGSILLVLLIALAINRKKVKEKNAENEMLLGEIHHRVKNNLQVISSLLSLQEKNISDESAKQAILEGKERVKSMGLIHKLLYQNDNYSGIEMDHYIHELIAGLLDSFGLDQDKVSIHSDIEKIKLDVDSAIPIGLIINELVINVFKYALDDTQNGSLTVKFLQNDEQLHLHIEDNGKGTVEDVEKAASFGSKLVRSLVRQVNGELVLKQDNGLKYHISIKDYKLV